MDGLRSDLLGGVSVLLAQMPGATAGWRLAEAIGGLGAAVTAFSPELDEAGEGGADWVRAQGRFDALVFDAGNAQVGGIEALQAVAEAAWVAVAAAAAGSFLPAGGGGRIVLVAPAREAGAYATAAADGLENLARTLSVEWARHGITTTAVVPAAASDPAHVQGTVAFLVSPAGAYHSGSRLDLDLLPGAR